MKHTRLSPPTHSSSVARRASEWLAPSDQPIRLFGLDPRSKACHETGVPNTQCDAASVDQDRPAANLNDHKVTNCDDTPGSKFKGYSASATRAESRTSKRALDSRQIHLPVSPEEIERRAKRFANAIKPSLSEDEALELAVELCEGLNRVDARRARDLARQMMADSLASTNKKKSTRSTPQSKRTRQK